jgi:hypothetical protein
VRNRVHLREVRPVILAEAVLNERLPAGALYVALCRGGRVHKRQIYSREKLAPATPSPPRRLSVADARVAPATALLDVVALSLLKY